MKRTTIWLTEAQITYLSAEAERLGIKQAELIRRIIDEYREEE